MKKLRLLLIYLLGFGFFSCTPKDKEPITIGLLDGPSVVSFIHMMTDSVKVEGRPLKFIVRSEPLQLQALMMQEKLDFAILPTVMAANLYNKGINYQVLGIPIWGTLYLLSNEPQTKELEDLSRQTVHVFGQGATADVLLREMLHQEKINDVRTDYSYVSNSEIARAILYKNIQHAILSEPMVTELLQTDSSIHIIRKLSCEEIINDTTTNIFAQTSFLANHNTIKNLPDVTRQIVSLYAQSCELAMNELDSTAAKLVKNGFYSDFNLARQSIPRCNIQYVPAQEIKSEIMYYLKIFYTFEPRSVGGKMPDPGFIATIPASK